MHPNDTQTLARNLATLRERIGAADGDPDTIKVIAVSKGFEAGAVRGALELGLFDIGENYAQELVSKAGELANSTEPVRWHFLGRLQRNKIAGLAPIVDLFQSVARVSEGELIARHRPGAAVLCEVETTGAPERNGCAPAEVPRLVEELGALGLAVNGLMTVAPPDPEGARVAFETVRALADRLGLAERSMGMTDDLELAVQTGTTMLRIGRGLFGARPERGR
jgi:pyridoxal phosphate enzyme (YggS family)